MMVLKYSLWNVILKSTIKFSHFKKMSFYLRIKLYLELINFFIIITRMHRSTINYTIRYNHTGRYKLKYISFISLILIKENYYIFFSN